jgi:outer membrane protein insertion porin family
MFTSPKVLPGIHPALLPLLWLLIVLVGALSVQAQPTYQWARYNGWEVSSFEVAGLPGDMNGVVSPHLALAGTRKLFRTQRPPFQVKLLAADLERIRLYLSRMGYPTARTFPEAHLKPEKKQLGLLIRVEPGPRAMVGTLSWEGWPTRAAVPDSSEKNFIQEGQPFLDGNLQNTRQFLQRWLQDRGFAQAEVDFAISLNDSHRVDVDFTIRAGDYYQIEGLEIRGTQPDLERVVRRVANFHPPQEYSQTRREEMANDLRWTQLFRQVEMTTSSNQPGHLILEAQLEDARMRAWSASVGTWTDNPLMAEVGWTHRNLFKHGVGFDSFASVATHRVNLGTGVYWLGWLTPRAKTRAGLEYLVQDEDAYKSKEEILDIVQAFRPNNRDSWKVGITTSLTEVDIYDPDSSDLPEGQGWLLEFWSDGKLDRTDNPIFPTTGAYLKLSGTVAPPGLISEVPYLAGQMDVAGFQSLAHQTILTGRLRVGLSSPLGDASDLLATRRFYAGGFNTMRGYTRRALGPEDSDGNPRGGQSTFLASLELRFPIISIVQGAAFVDAGQVWEETGQTRLADLAAAWGLALDVRTPIGPLRLNYARNFANLKSGQSDSVWLFGIGYPW